MFRPGKLIEIKYAGHVGQEFIPTRAPLEGLREAWQPLSQATTRTPGPSTAEPVFAEGDGVWVFDLDRGQPQRHLPGAFGGHAHFPARENAGDPPALGVEH